MSDIYGSLIDGEWNKSGVQTPNINPSDVSETLGHMVSASVRPGINIEISREPVGVAGLITPWNFPIAIAAWKMGPACV